jgi:hypothetical protein
MPNQFDAVNYTATINPAGAAISCVWKIYNSAGSVLVPSAGTITNQSNTGCTITWQTIGDFVVKLECNDCSNSVAVKSVSVTASCVTIISLTIN